jgi:hypothetical protein
VVLLVVINHENELMCMPKKKKGKRPAKERTNPSPGEQSTPGDRVAWLLKTVWDGNRSEMARAVGCSHSVLVKIAAGQQDAGRRLLMAIASHPKVNPAWLISGQGEPLLVEERSPSSAEGWPLAISRQLLPGDPSVYRQLLSGEHFPTAGAFYRTTRYWLEVQHGHPIIRAWGEKIESGDLLLVETAPEFRQHPEQVDDTLCIVRLKPAEPLKLGRVTIHPGTDDDPECCCFDGFEQEHNPTPAATEEIVLHRHADGEVEVMKQRKRRRPVAGHLHFELLPSLASIVAVSLQVVRR